MGVEQDDRSALGSLPLADHGRRGAVVGSHDLSLDTLGGQELGGFLRGFVHLGQALRVGADGLDSDEILKVADQAREDVVDTVL